MKSELPLQVSRARIVSQRECSQGQLVPPQCFPDYGHENIHVSQEKQYIVLLERWFVIPIPFNDVLPYQILPSARSRMLKGHTDKLLGRRDTLQYWRWTDRLSLRNTRF